MNLNINLNLYKYFYEVAKYNSYTKAAESLMISQPSLSYSIKVLETQLEKKLFVRDNNKIKLTDDGNKLFVILDEIYKRYGSDSDDSDIKGTLTLGVRSAFAAKVLPFYINEFNKIHPNLEINYVIDSSSKLLNLLNNKQIDILIDEQRIDDDEIKSILYVSNKAVLYTTKENAKNYDNKLSLTDLKKEKICLCKTNINSHVIMDKYPELEYVLCQSTPLMLLKIEESNILGISPKAIIDKELKEGTLKEIKTDFDIPSADMYISFIKRLENNNMRCFIEFFLEHYKKRASEE